MLKDLIVQVFCREITRKLRRLGVLGALICAYFALHVEVPLEISIATKEAQIAVIDLQRSVERSLSRLEHHDLHPLHMPSAKRS
jgi:hypothetical protein